MAIIKTKKIFTIYILFILTLSLGSCEKCMRCTYYYYESSPVEENWEQYQHEECGNDKEIELFRESMEYAAEQFDTTVTCVSW